MKAAITGTRTARYQTNDYKNKEAKLGMKIPGITVSYENVSKRHRAITSRFTKEVSELGAQAWGLSTKYYTKATVRYYAKYFLTHDKFAKEVVDAYSLNPYTDLNAALDVLYEAWNFALCGEEDRMPGDYITL